MNESEQGHFFKYTSVHVLIYYPPSRQTNHTQSRINAHERTREYKHTHADSALTGVDGWEGDGAVAFALTMLQDVLAMLLNPLNFTLEPGVNDFPAVKRPRSRGAHQVCRNAH